MNMAFDGECYSIATRALELESLAPLVEHSAAECEMCADYQKEYLDFARTALPKLAEAYLALARASVEAFENAKMRGRFLEDVQQENQRLQKEVAARESELDELLQAPVKKGWLG